MQPSLNISRFIRERDYLVIPVIVFLILRLLTEITVLTITRGNPVQPPEWIYYNSTGATYNQTLPPSSFLYPLVEPWQRYDTLWYTKNAMQGFLPNDPGIVFLPLYSILIRLVVPFTGGSYTLAALIISNVSCLITFILLYQLVLLETKSKAMARQILLCVAVFPTAYYLVAGYTESLFLALTIGAILLAFNQKWGWAGLLAFGAGFTRLQGVILCLPLAWIAYIHYRSGRWRDWLVKSPAVLGSLLGTGLYLTYLAAHGYSTAAVYASEWKSSTNWPWASVLTYLTRLTTGQTAGYENDNAVMLLIFAVLGIIVLWRLRPVYWLYVGLTLIAFMMRYYVDFQLQSMTRYVLVLFPCFIIIGNMFRRRWLLFTYIAVALPWQILLLSRFTRWIWVA